MSKYWWFPAILLLITPEVWANGGPVAWTETTPVGAIGLKQNQSVSLVSENLQIKVLDLNTYSVKAHYRLHSSARLSKLQFGVPINWTFSEFRDVDPDTLENRYDQPPPKEVVKDVTNISQGIRLKVNGSPVRCRPMFDRHAFLFAKQEDSQPGSNTRVAAWCVATIGFKKGENRLSLEYHAQMDFEDMVFSKSALTEFSDRGLTYLLYPAGYWDGVAGEIQIVIDPGPYKGYLTIKQPQGFVQDNERWVWTQKQVDLKQVRMVDVTLDRSVDDANQLATWNKWGDIKFNKATTVRASSELPPSKKTTYVAANVLDGDPDTAWCKGAPGDGVGQYLEFRAKKDSFAKNMESFCTLEGLIVSKGYLKSQGVYMLNNRISKIAISDCNGGNKTEVPSLVKADDYRFGTAFIRRGYLRFIPNASCFRIEILDTIPGQVNDTCISEVSLVVNCG